MRPRHRRRHSRRHVRAVNAKYKLKDRRYQLRPPWWWTDDQGYEQQWRKYRAAKARNEQAATRED